MKIPGHLTDIWTTHTHMCTQTYVKISTYTIAKLAFMDWSLNPIKAVLKGSSINNAAMNLFPWMNSRLNGWMVETTTVQVHVQGPFFP